MEFFGFLFLSIFGNHSEDNGRRLEEVGGSLCYTFPGHEIP